MVEAEEGSARRMAAQRREAAEVLGWLFAARPDDRRLGRLAHAALMQNAPLRETLLMPRNVVPLVARVPDRPAGKGKAVLGRAVQGKPVRELPLWLLQSDWPEFLGAEAWAALVACCDLPARLALTAPDLGPPLETALEGGRDFRRPRRPEAVQLGLYASALAVHGKFNRALKLLHWLDGARPGQADVAKRLANVCWFAGNQEAALRWLRAAAGAAPGNALLHLALAQRLVEAGYGPAARKHLALAEELWPELELSGVGLADGEAAANERE